MRSALPPVSESERLGLRLPRNIKERLKDEKERRLARGGYKPSINAIVYEILVKELPVSRWEKSQRNGHNKARDPGS